MGRGGGPRRAGVDEQARGGVADAAGRTAQQGIGVGHRGVPDDRVGRQPVTGLEFAREDLPL